MNNISTPDSYKSASSYGASFSENVSVIGNQIQIAQPSLVARPIVKPDEFTSNLQKVSLNESLNNRFMLKFSEQELKVIKLRKNGLVKFDIKY